MNEINLFFEKYTPIIHIINYITRKGFLLNRLYKYQKNDYIIYSNMDTILQTKRLLLRKWTENDITHLIRMNQDKEVMRFFLDTMTEQQSIDFYHRVQRHFQETGYGLYVVEEVISGAFLGYTGCMIATFESAFTPCVEIGWRFNKKYWGNGFATEAALACLHYGFSALKFDAIYSFTSLHNEKSEAVMQRIGMKKIGEFFHPRVPIDHPLCLHVTYTIEK